MLHELLWALAALALLGLLLMMGIVGKSPRNSLRPRVISLNDLISERFAYAVFMVIFMIIALPLYPFYVLGAGIWQKYHPPAGAVPLPVEGDDPIWGRIVNRKLVETTFLAVQQAWAQHDTENLKGFVAPELRADLRRECRRLIAQHVTSTRQEIHIAEIHISNERIDDFKFRDGTHAINYLFDATIRGTMISFTTSERDGQLATGSPEPQIFEEQMQFSRGTEATDQWWLVMCSQIPEHKVAHTNSNSRKHDQSATAHD